MYVTWWVLTKRTLGVHKNYGFDQGETIILSVATLVAPEECIGPELGRGTFAKVLAQVWSLPSLQPECVDVVWVHMGWAF
jgi:hypothetical protein